MKSKIIAATMLAIVVIAAGYVLYRAQRPATAYSLRLKWTYDPGFAGELIAKKQGYFSDAGLDIDIQPGGFEADPIKLVASGGETFGVAGADTFLLARASGVPIVAFGAGYIQTPVVYYVRAESTIHRVADFPGRRVGIQAGQDTETIYRAILSKSGVDRAKISEIPVQYDFSPFLTGQVDVWPGYAASQSFTLHQKQILYRVITPAESGISFIGTVYFTTEKMIRSNPEKVQGFLDAVIKGWETAYSDRSIALSSISAFDSASLSNDLIAWNLDQQARSIRPDGRRFCEITTAELQNMALLLTELGLLKSTIDIGDAFDPQFLNNHYK